MKIKIIKEGSFTDAIDKMIGSDLDGSGIDDSLDTQPPKGRKTSITIPKRRIKDTRPRHQRILEDDKGYKVKKELGSGMYGSVFLAIDPEGKQVAIKVLSESGIGDMAVNKEMSNYQIVLFVVISILDYYQKRVKYQGVCILQVVVISIK